MEAVMNQSFSTDKTDSSPPTSDHEAAIALGYDLALSSLLGMLDEIDPLTASELRARLGIDEQEHDHSAPSTSYWHHPGST
jgi:hypothetical protein